MKKLITLLMVLAAFASDCAAISGTVYFAINTNYTLKLWVRYGTFNGDAEDVITMTKTDKTYKGLSIYSASFNNANKDGVGILAFQAFDGSTFKWEDKILDNVWTTNLSAYDGKLHEVNVSGMQAYNYDKTVIVHYKNTSSWSNVYCHNFYNNGSKDVSETGWPGKVASVNSLNSEWYDYTITAIPCTTIILNNGDNPGSEGYTKTPSIAIGDEAEYWVTDGSSASTATSTLPSSFTYTRDNLSDGKFGTICLPYAVTAVTGAKVYKIASKVMNEVDVAGVNLTEVSSLEAGKPYIFQAEGSSFTATLSGNNTEASSDFGMVGNVSSTPVTVYPGYYVIQDNKMKEVVSGGEGVTCGQYRAYITLDGINVEGAGARGTLFFGLDDESTGIESIQAEQSQNVTYNLQGQRVMDGQKGLFIMNGKKHIRK